MSLHSRQAHPSIALWHPSMFGFNYPFQSGGTSTTLSRILIVGPENNYNNNDPVVPLKLADELAEEQWFAHGFKGYPPEDGVFMELDSGGTFVGELQCNRAGTTYRDPVRTDPIPHFACDVRRRLFNPSRR